MLPSTLKGRTTTISSSPEPAVAVTTSSPAARPVGAGVFEFDNTPDSNKVFQRKHNGHGRGGSQNRGGRRDYSRRSQGPDHSSSRSNSRKRGPRRGAPSGTEKALEEQLAVLHDKARGDRDAFQETIAEQKRDFEAQVAALEERMEALATRNPQDREPPVKEEATGSQWFGGNEAQTPPTPTEEIDKATGLGRFEFITRTAATTVFGWRKKLLKTRVRLLGPCNEKGDLIAQWPGLSWDLRPRSMSLTDLELDKKLVSVRVTTKDLHATNRAGCLMTLFCREEWLKDKYVDRTFVIDYERFVQLLTVKNINAQIDGEVARQRLVMGMTSLHHVNSDRYNWENAIEENTIMVAKYLHNSRQQAARWPEIQALLLETSPDLMRDEYWNFQSGQKL